MSTNHEPGLCPYCQTQMVNCGAPIWEDYCPNKECDGEAKAFRRGIAEHSRRAKALNQVREAAPDLLEALRVLLAMHQPYHNSIEHSAARAAIAKAEGRS